MIGAMAHPQVLAFMLELVKAVGSAVEVVDAVSLGIARELQLEAQ